MQSMLASAFQSLNETQLNIYKQTRSVTPSVAGVPLLSTPIFESFHEHKPQHSSLTHSQENVLIRRDASLVGCGIPEIRRFQWVEKSHHGQTISVPRFQCSLCSRWFSLNHPLDHFKREHGIRIASSSEIPGRFHEAVNAARKRLPLPICNDVDLKQHTSSLVADTLYFDQHRDSFGYHGQTTGTTELGGTGGMGTSTGGNRDGSGCLAEPGLRDDFERLVTSSSCCSASSTSSGDEIFAGEPLRRRSLRQTAIRARRTADLNTLTQSEPTQELTTLAGPSTEEGGPEGELFGGPVGAVGESGSVDGGSSTLAAAAAVALSELATLSPTAANSRPPSFLSPNLASLLLQCPSSPEVLTALVRDVLSSERAQKRRKLQATTSSISPSPAASMPLVPPSLLEHFKKRQLHLSKELECVKSCLLFCSSRERELESDIEANRTVTAHLRKAQNKISSQIEHLHSLLTNLSDKDVDSLKKNRSPQQKSSCLLKDDCSVRESVSDSPKKTSPRDDVVPIEESECLDSPVLINPCLLTSQEEDTPEIVIKTSVEVVDLQNSEEDT